MTITGSTSTRVTKPTTASPISFAAPGWKRGNEHGEKIEPPQIHHARVATGGRRTLLTVAETRPRGSAREYDCRNVGWQDSGGPGRRHERVQRHPVRRADERQESIHAAGQTAAGSPAQQSEDCLVLNVFAPANKDGRKRPVMVWLHGGGFASGSGSGRILDGTSLAHAHDVVVVTLNHRLNVFGYTYLGEAMGSDFAPSSSVGLLDIVAALEWVRDNIAGLGGDPNLVTIFGQSGGGRKVATLMAMPAAQGLFHRAVIESGAVLRLTTHDDAVKQAGLLLAELGLTKGQVRELQNVPLERLLAADHTRIQKRLSMIGRRRRSWHSTTPGCRRARPSALAEIRHASSRRSRAPIPTHRRGICGF